ncbi:hypothetical protein ACFVYD_27385 [Streptomyces sp. NPDC058301]
MSVTIDMAGSRTPTPVEDLDQLDGDEEVGRRGVVKGVVKGVMRP